MLERPIDSFFRGSSGDGKNCSRCIAINKSKREKEKRKKYQGKDIRVWMMFGNDRSLAISRAWRSYRDFLMYLKTQRDVYYDYGYRARCISPFRPTLPYLFPCLLPHFSSRWYIYTCTCIHDLRIIHTHTRACIREETR